MRCPHLRSLFLRNGSRRFLISTRLVGRSWESHGADNRKKNLAESLHFDRVEMNSDKYSLQNKGGLWVTAKRCKVQSTVLMWLTSAYIYIFFLTYCLQSTPLRPVMRHVIFSWNAGHHRAIGFVFHLPLILSGWQEKKKVWCPLVTNMGNNMVVISHAQFPFRFRNSCKMFGDLEVIQKKFYREHVCWSICLLAWRNAFLSHFFYLLTTFVISIHTFTARSWGDKSLITVTSWQQQVLRLWTVSSVFQVTGK